jgi:hypothetical protein
MSYTDPLDRLVDSLREVDENFLEVWSRFTRSVLTSALKELAESLLETESARPFDTRLIPWPSRNLLALDLAVDYGARGLWPWKDHVENFPLRPGFKGVVWSRTRGYEVVEDGGWSTDDDDDEDDKRERQNFLRSQRRLDRNIETHSALLGAGQCDPVPEIHYADSDTDNDTDDEQKAIDKEVKSAKAFDRQCVDYDDLMSGFGLY